MGLLPQIKEEEVAAHSERGKLASWIDALIIPPGGISVTAIVVLLSSLLKITEYGAYAIGIITALLLIRSCLVLKQRWDGRWLAQMYHVCSQPEEDEQIDDQ